MEAQLTQAELGKKIGVSWEMISRYENGKSSARQNLELLADVLGKPIQYFFGVEDVPLTEEIQKLTKLLKEKGKEFEKRGTVPMVGALSEFGLEKALDLTNQSYFCPSWIYANFQNIFALRMNEVDSKVVTAGVDDVGYFTKGKKPEPGNFVLVKREGEYWVEKYSKSEKLTPLAILIAIEKRYISR